MSVESFQAWVEKDLSKGRLFVFHFYYLNDSLKFFYLSAGSLLSVFGSILLRLAQLSTISEIFVSLASPP